MMKRGVGALAAMALALLPALVAAQVPAAQDGRQRLQNRFGGSQDRPQQQQKFDEALRKFNDEELQTRLEGVEALGRTDDAPKALGYLLQAANEPTPSIRLKAIDTLGNIRARGAVAPLVQQLFMRDTDKNTKQHILVALGKIGDPRATRPVLDFLARDNDAGLEGNAIFALGEIGDKTALEPLELIAHTDGDASLQALARTAVRKIHEKPPPDVQPPALAADRRRGAPPEGEEEGVP